MKETIESKIKKMINIKYRYAGKNTVITNYHFNEEKERVYVYLDGSNTPTDRPYDAAMEYLRQFEEVNTDLTFSEASVSRNFKTTTNLKDILLDNIKNIKDNSLYIPQAQEISKQVGQVINVIRAEMECIRLAQSFNENKD